MIRHATVRRLGAAALLLAAVPASADLLGLSPDFPKLEHVRTSDQAVSYTAVGGMLFVDSQPFNFQASAGSIQVPVINATPGAPATRVLEIAILVDPLTGELVGGVAGGDDLVVTGCIDDAPLNLVCDPGETVGTLLTGKIVEFGWDNNGVDRYDFRFVATGGALAGLFAGQDLGVTVSSENSTFNGSFEEDFNGQAKGEVGAVPPLPAALGDRVWEDCDGDGVQDGVGGGSDADCDGDGTPDVEPGVPGVTVNLLEPGPDGFCGTGDEVATGDTRITDAGGLYLFDPVAPGPYCVEFVRPTGYACTVANVPDGTLPPGTRDSDVVDLGDGTCQTVDPTQDPIAIESGETDLSWDAGLVRPASLGDFVWDDDSVERNDVQDPGEAGVPGVVVTLLDCDGNQVTTDVEGNPISPVETGASGFYEFLNLRPGGYRVRFEPPADPDDYVFVTARAGGDDAVDSDAETVDGTGRLTRCVTLASGEDNPDIDAGLARIAESRLGDFVWEDDDADGTQDAGEEGIEGVDVELWICDADGPSTDTGLRAPTNGSGFYLFDGLTAGRYAVRFPVESLAPPAGDFRSSPQNASGDEATDSDADPDTGFSACIDLGISDENLDLDAGFFRPASIGDFVWDDDSVVRNDVQDASEAGVAGALVTLEDCDGNTIIADVDGEDIEPVTTDASGFYQFVNLRPGDYKVRFEPPAGYEFVAAREGGDDTVDSDAETVDGAGRLTRCVTLESGEDNPDIDAGLARIAESRLGDFVWEDLDADGTQVAGEPGIGGVEVELWVCDAAGGDPIAFTGSTEETNASGLYYFEGLTAGSYAVRFPVEALTLPVGAFRSSPQNASGDGATDSDADPVSGFSACIALGVSDENLDLDAGFFRPASLGDFVWDDDSVARNDQQDTGEAGVPGALVTLEDCDGNVITTDVDGNQIGTVTTGASGLYAFVNLRPGEYKVRFDPPAGYDFVVPGVGAPNVDSDAVPLVDGSGLTACVTLESNQDDPTIDAGLFSQSACDITVEKTCAIVPPPVTEAFACSDAKPIDALTMRLAADAEIVRVDAYSDEYDPSKPLENLMQVLPGPFVQGDEVRASGYAAAGAPNNVDWLITFADGTTAVSRFHRSCSDPQMNGPEDCGLNQGNGKENDDALADIWALEAIEGNGQVLDCSVPDPVPSTETACEFATPAAPHCLGKVESVTFQYLGGDCVVSPNDQEGKAKCLTPGSVGEAVRVVVSDGGSKIYLDTGAPGSVSAGDVLTASAANAGESQFASNSLIEIFSETGALEQEVEFHTSCSKPLNLNDRYGSLLVIGLDTTDGGVASLGAEVRYDYRFTNNSAFPFLGTAVDDWIGTLLDPLDLAAAPGPGNVETTSRTVFVLPGADDVVVNTASVFAADGTFCGEAFTTVTRVPPPPDSTPVSCSDIKPVTAVSVVWNGSETVDITMESGERFEGVAPQSLITFQEDGTGNDVEMTIFLAGTDQVLGSSVFHVSCSDEAMNGSEDCGSSQGNGKGNDAGLLDDWLFEGMTGEQGSFACGLPNAGEVPPTEGGGGTGPGGLSAATVLDLSDDKKVKWELSNAGAADVLITGITVSWPGAHETLKKMKLDGDEFAKDVLDDSSPTALTVADFESDENRRRLDAGKSEVLEVEFTTGTLFRDQTDFEITVEFDSGDVLVFTPAPLFVTGAATVDLGDPKKLKWDVTNHTTGDVLVTEISVDWPPAHGKLEKMKIDGATFFDEADDATPTALPAEFPFKGNEGDRALDAGKTGELLLEFDKEVAGRTAADFTLVVKFSNGNEVTLP